MAYMQTNVNRIRHQYNVSLAREGMTAALMRTNYASLYPRVISTDRRPTRH